MKSGFNKTLKDTVNQGRESRDLYIFLILKPLTKMKNQKLQTLLDSELENVKGGVNNPDDDVCICESGAASVIIIDEPGEEPED